MVVLYCGGHNRAELARLRTLDVVPSRFQLSAQGSGGGVFIAQASNHSRPHWAGRQSFDLKNQATDIRARHFDHVCLFSLPVLIIPIQMLAPILIIYPSQP